MKNLASGPPTRLLLRFTFPLILGGLMQQAYQLTDAAVVGRVLGPHGLAAVGSVGTLIFLLKGFGWGSTNGLVIPVSKAFGASDMPETRRNIAAGAYVAALIALFVTTIGVVFGRSLLRLIGVPSYLFQDAATYLTITISGALFTVVFAYLSAVFRAVGDSKTPLYFGIASQVINAALTIWFVAFLGLGVAGAAAATLIPQATSLLICLVYMARKAPEIIPNRAEWRAGLSRAKTSARTGLPMGMQSCAIATGAVILQAAVNTLGGDGMAAYATAGRIEGIIISPLHAFNVAVVTFTAQNRGAEKWLRIRGTVTKAAGVIVGVALSLGLLQFVFARQLVLVFLPADYGTPVELAITYLRITAFMFFILGLKFVIRGAVQGMGNSLIPTTSTFLELVVRAILAFWLVGSFGLVGIAFAAPLAWSAGVGLNLIWWFKMRRDLLARHKTQLLEKSETKSEYRAVA